MKGSLEAVRFALELAMLLALAVAGTAASWVVAVLLPVIAVAIWGYAIAPKASHRLPDPARLALECALFAATGGALAAAGHLGWGVAFVVASVAVAIGLRATGSAA